MFKDGQRVYVALEEITSSTGRQRRRVRKDEIFYISARVLGPRLLYTLIDENGIIYKGFRKALLIPIKEPKKHKFTSIFSSNTSH